MELLHHFFQKPLRTKFDKNISSIILGMGCFWGVEKIFWNTLGVEMTAVGYSGGSTLNPTYSQVCSGNTGHNEVVLVHYDKNIISLETILRLFWEGHDPTQGMRQGNDIGTQYRSGIYTFSDEDLELAFITKRKYQLSLEKRNYGKITTEILRAKTFYYAEHYHQQYLSKNPKGYCGLGGTGVKF